MENNSEYCWCESAGRNGPVRTVTGTRVRAVPSDSESAYRDRPGPEWERRLGAWATVTAALQADSESVRITHLESWPPGQLGISRYEILMLQCTWYIAVYLSMRISYLVYTELFWVHHGMGDFIDTQFCHILEWFSNVWICTHACPITRHRGLESKLKKSCADFDLSILRSYRYIPVYTE